MLRRTPLRSEVGAARARLATTQGGFMRFSRGVIAVLSVGALVLGSPRSLTSQAPPAGVTAKCGDGTYSKAKNKQGACSNHKGVAEWYGTATNSAAATAVPANATALCNDGSYSKSQHRSGTCSHHGGVKTWLKEVPN